MNNQNKIPHFHLNIQSYAYTMPPIRIQIELIRAATTTTDKKENNEKKNEEEKRGKRRKSFHFSFLGFSFLQSNGDAS